MFRMKTEKFQLHGNDSVCAGAFQLLRGRAPAHLRGNKREDDKDIHVYDMKEYRVSRDIAPLILNLGTRCR
jgi:hypothetical protein